MGSKGSDPPSDTGDTTPQTVDLSGMYSAMAEMQAMMSNQIISSQQQMYELMDSAPSATASPYIDWTTKQNELKKKIAADYTDASAGRKGRESTIIVDPLNDETPPLTSSVLSGK